MSIAVMLCNVTYMYDLAVYVIHVAMSAVIHLPEQQAIFHITHPQ